MDSPLLPRCFIDKSGERESPWCGYHNWPLEQCRDEMAEAAASALAEAATWEQMYAQHVAVAKVIHDLAHDDDPHRFGRETASCDWLADLVIDVSRAAVLAILSPEGEGTR